MTGEEAQPRYEDRSIDDYDDTFFVESTDRLVRQFTDPARAEFLNSQDMEPERLMAQVTAIVCGGFVQGLPESDAHNVIVRWRNYATARLVKETQTGETAGDMSGKVAAIRAIAYGLQHAVRHDYLSGKPDTPFVRGLPIL